ncbi:MAG TPA: Na+/H+ antiporter NhaC family protein [Methanocorpusculum sp.]|nr:Na+/H+ antiporter NhaC family protein [Methanocorpusculum sp.]HJJ66878.1 Na+/H+ antiporter NhaC family protein [Methanocorpusculum sp.]HJJ75372.1 Na+/H+ antiporter NhaC family protein [Methanocorpusculum sp.]HJJ76247.1 Na+/H+ antiporter NhaC family protein [Methanocorpusculum sp.]
MDKTKLANIIAIVLTLAAFLIPVICGYFGSMPEGGDAEAFAALYGVWTLIPPLLALLLAFLTRNVILSLFLGVLSGAWMIALVSGDLLGSISGAFFSSTDYFVGTLADRWDAGIIMQVLVIGALIALITRMGGMRAIADLVVKVAKGPRSAQITMWISSWVIFFDDYANALIIGPIMRPLCDKYRISREKLAYIVDSTAAPVAGIMLISTWIGTELVNINEGLAIAGITGVSAYGIFIDTIPYRFYNIMALFFVFATAFLLRDFGPMLKAEMRARTTGETINPGSEVMDTEKVVDEEKEEIKEDYGILKSSKKVTPPNIWNAIIPVAVLIISAVILFYTNGAACVMDGGGFVTPEEFAQLSFFESVREAYSASDASIVLFQAGLLACIVALIMGFVERIFTIKDGIETWAHGMKSMLFVCIVLILAWSIGSVIGDLGTAHFLVDNLSDALPAFIVPALIFVIAAVVSFATGTAYGTMAILLPLCIPLAAAIVGITGMEITSAGSEYAYILMCSSAVLTGAIFGDHSSPISDTSILSSMGAGCSLIDHVMTQIVYAVTVGVVVIAGYILVGLGLNVWITLIAMAAILVLVLLFAGKKVPTWNGKEAAE